jgi:hypothetical protein
MAFTAPSRAARLGAALAALGLLASCAPGGRLPVRDEGDILRGPLTTWTGGLHCALGFGDASGTLTLRGELGNVEAIFAYRVTEPFTQIPPGRLRMTGRVGSDGSLELRGTRWIDWPAGQGLFDLTGTLDARRGTISGTVPQCGEGSPFFLERLAEPQ